jgi:hypothetical protein
VLEVDHAGAGWRDRDVVNVCGTVRDTAVVRKGHTGIEVPGQRPRDALTSVGTPSRCLLVLRLTLNGQQESTETWVAPPGSAREPLPPGSLLALLAGYRVGRPWFARARKWLA